MAALRRARPFVPGALSGRPKDGRIVGHILLTAAKSVGGRDGSVLAPLSAVLPENQRQGIGSALMEAGRQAGNPWAMTISPVLGVGTTIPGRATFLRATGYQAPFEVPPENSWLCACGGRSPGERRAAVRGGAAFEPKLKGMGRGFAFVPRIC